MNHGYYVIIVKFFFQQILYKAWFINIHTIFIILIYYLPLVIRFLTIFYCIFVHFMFGRTKWNQIKI